MAQDNYILFSAVKNTSGGARTFSFLPPHGRTLANNQEIYIMGDLASAMRRGDESTDVVNRRALLAAVRSGALGITKTPAVVVKDATAGTSVILGCDNGTPNDYPIGTLTDQVALAGWI